MDERTLQIRRAMLAACGIADRPEDASSASFIERARSRDRDIAGRFAALSRQRRAA